MDLDTLLIIAVIISGFAILAFLLFRQKNSVKDSGGTLEWLRSMQMSLDNTNKMLQDTIRGSTAETNRVLLNNNKELNERLDTAARVIGDLKKNLGEMSEVGRGIKSLQEFLQSPKLRGNIGEQVLADMIGQTFPRSAFHLQYQFPSGVKVDAALLTDGGILPIDAKFPMENFRKMLGDDDESGRKQAKKDFATDIKKHVSDISKKYILPDNGTLDFALMYIPSEAVYYEVAGNDELMDFARQARVYPVSPNTLYAHLQVLLLSFQGHELEQKSKEVLRLLRAIQIDYSKVEENLNVLGKHISNAYNGLNNTSGALVQLGQKLQKTKLLEK